MQADLIFKKLTGLEKPRGHPLLPTTFQGGKRNDSTSGANINSANQNRKGKQAMDFNKFVKALAQVGSEIYGVPMQGYEISTLNAMITNTLIELDQ